MVPFNNNFLWYLIHGFSEPIMAVAGASHEHVDAAKLNTPGQTLIK